ncbi:hypothetical protein [Herbaspirillum sp. YR522]|uniref:hypothetical protein n=1 Tax=Herbaspirillum sp. YR522 TaxID=1144342 RepID=UPI00026FC515|nr:hypothetical protein [Herbaspirillum sp. YR522]EJM99772.1 hypothetical protein PMI40_03657 [Herbaspirillum sp. YR522]
MSKDQGASDSDFVTNNGDAGRGLFGSLSAPLLPGERLRVSTDGGTTWLDASVNGQRWTVVDPNAHRTNWTVKMEVVNGSGSAATYTQDIMLDAIAPNAPVSITRSDDTVTVGIAGTNAAAGDTLHVTVGRYTFDQVLRASDIAVGTVLITIPPSLLPSVLPGTVLGASLIDQAGNSSAYRTLGAGFVDFNSAVYTLANGESSTAVSSQAVLTGDLHIGGVGNFTFESSEARGNMFSASNSVLMVKSMSGYMSRVSFELLEVSSPGAGTRVTFYDERGDVIHATTYAVNKMSQTVSFTAPSGRNLSYIKLDAADGSTGTQFKLNNFNYTVDGVAKSVDFTRPSFRYGDGSAIGDDTFNIQPFYLDGSHGMQINSSGWISSYTPSDGATNYTTGNRLLVGADQSTTLTLPGNGMKSVSLDVAAGTAGHTVVFYNGLGQVLHTSEPLPVASNWTTSQAVFTPVRFTAPVGESIAYLIVKTVDGNGAQIDNIGYSNHADSYLNPFPAEYKVMPGADAYYGGPGNETFVLPETRYFLASGAGVHGGAGIDTLKLTGADQTLELSTMGGFSTGAKISSIEKIDLTGNGDNKLKLSLNDVLNLGGRDLFVTDGKTQFMVNGNHGDRVELSKMHGNGVDPGSWAKAVDTVTVAGQVYNVYEHSVTHAELLVQQAVTTTLV